MRIAIAQYASREEILFVTDAGTTQLAQIVHEWETETGRNLTAEGATVVTRDVRCYAVADLAGTKSTLASVLERIKASAPTWFEKVEDFVTETAEYVQGVVTPSGISRFPDTNEIAIMTPGERRIRLIALFKALGAKADAMGMALPDDAVTEILTHIVGDLDYVGDKIGENGWRKLLDVSE